MLGLIPVHEPDLTEVEYLCSDYMNKYVASGVEDPLSEYWIYKEVLKALYGNGIFEVLKELRERKLGESKSS